MIIITPKSKSSALALGLSRYMPDRACKRGHLAERYTKDGSCTLCKLEDRKANKEANAAYSRKWRKANPGYRAPSDERSLENARANARYASDPEKFRGAIYAWRRLNPEKFKESVKKSYQKHKEKRRAEAAARYARIADIRREKDKIYRSSNLQLLRDRTRRWRCDNPEKARVSDRNKRAMRRAAIGKHTKEQIDRLRDLQKGRCPECRAVLRKIGEHVDHFVALSKGGTNSIDNLQILCPPCNLRKRNKDPFVFARENGRLL